MGKGTSSKFHHVVWNNISPPKHCFINWVASYGKLLTMDKISRFIPSVDPICCLCKEEPETHNHLWFECCEIKKIISTIETKMGVKCCNSNQHATRICLMRSKRKKHEKNTCYALVNSIIYHSWIARNKIKFQKGIFTPNQICDEILWELTVREKKFKPI